MLRNQFMVKGVLLGGVLSYGAEGLGENLNGGLLEGSEIENYEGVSELIVTASRIPESNRDTAYNVTVFNGDTPKKTGKWMFPELFSYTPGVMVQKTTHGHGSPFIRGFTGRQNLYLVDGVRMNNSTWRSGPIQYANTLDVHALDRVEFVKSQGSVIFGSDAIGGTVNALTRSSRFRDEESGWFYGGESTYLFNGNSNSHLGRVEQRFGDGGKWGAVLGLSLKEFGDLEDSAVGVFQQTGYPEQSIDFKFEYALSESATLRFAHQYLNQDEVVRWHSTVLSDPDGDGISWQHGSYFTTAGKNQSRFYDQERSLSYLQIEETESSSHWLDSWKATLSYQESADTEHRVRASGQREERHQEVQTYGLTLQGLSTVGKGRLLFGLDYYRDEVDSKGYRNGAFHPSNRPVADDSTYETLGLYTQYQKQINDRWKATIGARYTHVKADWLGYRPESALEDQPGEGTWDNLSVEFRGHYQCTEYWNLYGGITQAFRAPNLDDLTGRQLALSGLDTSGSPDVSPEKYLTLELGSRWLSERGRFSLATYYTHIDDALVRIDDAAGGLVTANGQEGFVFGVELEAAWKIASAWELSAYASWQDGKVEALSSVGGELVEDTLHRLHPLSGGVALKWDICDGLWVQGRVTGAMRQDNLNSQISDSQRIPVGGTPGYVVGALHGGWDMNEQWSLYLTLDNITDEDYRIHGSGVNQQGRAFMAAVTYRW